MIYIQNFLIDFIEILNEMSPYLLLGFLFAGILKVYLPQEFIDKHLKKANFRSVLYAALLGVPMPLCSCGVIPTGISIYKTGAGKGATVSFLISTPQTGIDSILVTYSLLGLPFAVIRPIVALFTGVFGGIFTNRLDKNNENTMPQKTSADDSCSDACCSDSSCSDDSCSDGSCCNNGSCSTTSKSDSKIYSMLKYAFVDFLQDISKWLIIGVLLAAIISVLIPENFFELFIGNQWLEMIVILLVAIPLYVCATGSIPIAAVLMLKGLSPGAALVFLMAGPATNVATITVLRKSMGKQAMWSYLVSITVGAILFGAFINYFLPAEWFSIETLKHLHKHNFMPKWVEWGSTIMLILLIINGYYQKKKNSKLRLAKTSKIDNKDSKTTKTTVKMSEKIIIVNGMNCNHCKNSVEKHVSALPNIESAIVNLETKQLLIKGSKIDTLKIADELASLGFEYGGELKN